MDILPDVYSNTFVCIRTVRLIFVMPFILIVFFDKLLPYTGFSSLGKHNAVDFVGQLSTAAIYWFFFTRQT